MNPLKPLFFEQTLRHWRFEALVREAKLSRERVNHYLKQLLEEDFIGRVKPQGKMPYYISKNEKPEFRQEKRLFGLQKLNHLFAHIESCKNIKTAILFGSFARGDWGRSSDVDLFIYGDDSEFEKGKHELQLGRELQVFSFTRADAIKKELAPGVIQNIAKGFNIKGNLEPLEVSVNA